MFLPIFAKCHRMKLTIYQEYHGKRNLKKKVDTYGEREKEKQVQYHKIHSIEFIQFVCLKTWTLYSLSLPLSSLCLYSELRTFWNVKLKSFLTLDFTSVTCSNHGLVSNQEFHHTKCYTLTTRRTICNPNSLKTNKMNEKKSMISKNYFKLAICWPLRTFKCSLFCASKLLKAWNISVNSWVISK